MEDSPTWTFSDSPSDLAATNGALEVLVGVAAMVVGWTKSLVKGELPITLAGVSKMFDATFDSLVGGAKFAFTGVANIVLRAAPDSKALVLGAFEGVSAMLSRASFRPVALR